MHPPAKPGRAHSQARAHGAARPQQVRALVDFEVGELAKERGFEATVMGMEKFKDLEFGAEPVVLVCSSTGNGARGVAPHWRSQPRPPRPSPAPVTAAGQAQFYGH